ncbi:MAG: deoxyguanosinetriphosphate triphosphohydrolase [Oscillospiraceae bacterium]|nr:deoxyguanosinetriphosphate triphosphohydrolase [Oscillospiraceae bacterium]
MCIREEQERMELELLSPQAQKSSQTKGRPTPELPHELRTNFQRDTDRIVHCKSFRRLMHKTQVFLQPEGDHYRTRMTHTIEVSRIARTIARSLRLNEDLTEAISLGHDLGHTPFGHAGEYALRDILGTGFNHNEQSLRVVDKLEQNGRGLNLCYEVRSGILTHSGPMKPETLEAAVVRFSDRIAYINHDIDDACRAGILSNADIPEHIAKVLGNTHSQRINTLVHDLVDATGDGPVVQMHPEVADAMEELHDFMFERVYRNPVAKGEESKAKEIIRILFTHYSEHPDQLPQEYLRILERDGLERAVCDYIAGMTDKYAVAKFSDIFIPTAWSVKD